MLLAIPKVTSVYPRMVPWPRAQDVGARDFAACGPSRTPDFDELPMLSFEED